MLITWTPNTLPLPCYCGEETAEPVAVVAQQVIGDSQAPQSIPVFEDVVVDENDNFPKGRISKFFPFQRYGFVQDRNGREIFFNLAELDFVGQKGRESLKAGSAVGYDVSWTSRGLHVKRMKVY